MGSIAVDGSGPAAADSVPPVVADMAAVFAERAFAVDADGDFPHENFADLRTSGLLGLLVPVEYGGMGASLSVFADVARALGGACTSTAMLWAMHCQQASCVVRHASDATRAAVLPKVAGDGHLLASITTEPSKGGHLLSAVASLTADEHGERTLDRDAPVVSGGLYADGYLVTMRSAPDRPANDVSLAYLPRERAELEPRSGWSVLGMRATASGGLHIRGRLAEGDLVGGVGGFRTVAVTTMIPVGHIAWASVWLGSAQRALQVVISHLRAARGRSGQLSSDLFLHDLGRIRLQLDTLAAYLRTSIDAYESALACGQPEALDDVAFQMQINGLKVAVSEGAFAAVDAMVRLTGLPFGYQRDPGKPLERIFRDLRSAALMYSNDRLLVANGKLALMDRRVRLLGDRPDPPRTSFQQ